MAQLGGVHLACENVSNILTKILEWGRLMAYLEQSTRYVPYTDRPGWSLEVPRAGGTGRQPAPRRLRRRASTTPSRPTRSGCEAMQDHFAARYPREDGVSAGVYRRTIRAKALDAVRGLLPAATLANVGIYGTGQAYEALLLRMRAHPLRRGAGLRGLDARRAAQGDPGLSAPGGSARTRRAAGAATCASRGRASSAWRDRRSARSRRSRSPRSC